MCWTRPVTKEASGIPTVTSNRFPEKPPKGSDEDLGSLLAYLRPEKETDLLRAHLLGAQAIVGQEGGAKGLRCVDVSLGPGALQGVSVACLDSFARPGPVRDVPKSPALEEDPSVHGAPPLERISLYLWF